MYQLFYNRTVANTESPREAATATSAVVLVGDAVHAFPPDLGQGVNSALEDVFALHRALERHNDSLEAGKKHINITAHYEDGKPKSLLLLYSVATASGGEAAGGDRPVQVR
jgi:hypothetical protein